MDMWFTVYLIRALSKSALRVALFWTEMLPHRDFLNGHINIITKTKGNGFRQDRERLESPIYYLSSINLGACDATTSVTRFCTLKTQNLH